MAVQINGVAPDFEAVAVVAFGGATVAGASHALARLVARLFAPLATGFRVLPVA